MQDKIKLLKITSMIFLGQNYGKSTFTRFNLYFGQKDIQRNFTRESEVMFLRFMTSLLLLILT